MALALKLHSFSLLILQSIEHYLHIRRLLHMILFCYLLAKLRSQTLGTNSDNFTTNYILKPYPLQLVFISKNPLDFEQNFQVVPKIIRN